MKINIKTYLITNLLILFTIGIFATWFFNHMTVLKSELAILHVQYNSIACQLTGDYEVINFVKNKKPKTRKPRKVLEDNGHFNYLDEDL